MVLVRYQKSGTQIEFESITNLFYATYTQESKLLMDMAIWCPIKVWPDSDLQGHRLQIDDELDTPLPTPSLGSACSSPTALDLQLSLQQAYLGTTYGPDLLTSCFWQNCDHSVHLSTAVATLWLSHSLNNCCKMAGKSGQSHSHSVLQPS